MRKDVVVFITEVVGSVLSLCKTLKMNKQVVTHVVSLNCDYDWVLRSSRYVDNAKRLNASTADDFLNSIKDWYAENAFSTPPILFLTDDILCLWVNEKRDWFSNNFSLTLPSGEIVESFNFKGKAELEASKHGLLTPKTSFLSHVDDLDVVLTEFSFPVILKPSSAEMLTGIEFKKTKILEFEGFYSYSKKLIDNGASFVCQEFIPGEEGNSFFFLFYRCADGNIYSKIGRKKLQCPPNRGIMAVGITEYNEDIDNMSRKFLSSINYVGVGGIEYKKYQDKYYFIEMSTRLEGFFQLAEISGISLSEVAYCDIMYSTMSGNLPLEQIENVLYVDIVHYFLAMFNSRKYIESVLRFFAFCLNRRVEFNIWDTFDPLPFICNILLLIKTKLINK